MGGPRAGGPAAGVGREAAPRSRLKAGAPMPVSLRELAPSTPLRKVAWREGTKGKLSGGFAWLRVWPGGGRATGEYSGAGPVWLLIEEQADGKIKYALSNLPGRTSRIEAVRLWKGRWPMEQGYQQMEEELGSDHHEGRSWRGFHHHACLVMLAFGFLASEREREERGPARPGNGGTRRVITVPAVRRALQRPLAPICRHDCPSCRDRSLQSPLMLTVSYKSGFCSTLAVDAVIPLCPEDTGDEDLFRWICGSGASPPATEPASRSPSGFR